jgi:hypothetical protein
VFEVPYRLHSVRKRIIFLHPLPQEKQSFKKIPLTKLAWLLIGAGSCGVLGLALAPLVLSVFNPVSTTANLSTDQPDTGQPPSATAPSKQPHLSNPLGTYQEPRNVSNAIPVVSILLPTTDSNERLTEIKTGRRNPFTLVKTSAILAPTRFRTSQSEGSLNPQSSSRPGSVGRSTSSQTNTRNSQRTVPALPGSPPPAVPNFPPPPIARTGALPPPPSTGNSPFPASSGGITPEVNPDPLACNFKVSGVMQAGGRPMAVIQAENEPNPRTVRVGDRLCSGMVAIQDITGAGSSQATVVLSQNGSQTIRRVDTSSNPE